MRRWFRTDLHVHTCLSPCGDLSMSPRRIIAGALQQQIDILAVTDHNSAENAQAVMQAAKGSGMAVLPGLEVCSREEVHVLAIFDALTAARDLQAEVQKRLNGVNNPEAFGLQVIANEMDEVEGFQEKLLIGATDLSIEDIVRRIHRLHGLAIASHVDRESFGIIGQLGFIPPDLRFDALEISGAITDEDARTRFRKYENFAFIRNSDAHFLHHLGKNTTWFLLQEPACGEIRAALRRKSDRMAFVAPGQQGVN